MRAERQRWIDENGGSQRRQVTCPEWRRDSGTIGRQFHHRCDVVQPLGVVDQRPGQPCDLVRRRVGEQVVEFGKRIGHASGGGNGSDFSVAVLLGGVLHAYPVPHKKTARKLALTGGGSLW